MNNLGEILKQARQSKGVSLRDAAEATKIRSDFLANMEQGDFNFDLPEIYKRGFLRLYADYLDLDEAQIIADYNALAATRVDSETQKGTQAKTQFLSRLAADSSDSGSSRADRDIPNSDFADAPASPLESGSGDTKSSVAKIAAILVAVLVAIVVVVFAISALGSKSDEAQPAAQANAAQNKEFIITVTALEDTFYRLIPESNPNRPLFSDEARRGSTRSFTTTEPLIIYPKNLKQLKIERNGVAIDMSNAPIRPDYRLKAPQPAN